MGHQALNETRLSPSLRAVNARGSRPDTAALRRECAAALPDGPGAPPRCQRRAACEPASTTLAGSPPRPAQGRKQPPVPALAWCWQPRRGGCRGLPAQRCCRAAAPSNPCHVTHGARRMGRPALAESVAAATRSRWRDASHAANVVVEALHLPSTRQDTAKSRPCQTRPRQTGPIACNRGANDARKAAHLDGRQARWARDGEAQTTPSRQHACVGPAGKDRNPRGAILQRLASQTASPPGSRQGALTSACAMPSFARDLFSPLFPTLLAELFLPHLLSAGGISALFCCRQAAPTKPSCIALGPYINSCGCDRGSRRRLRWPAPRAAPALRARRRARPPSLSAASHILYWGGAAPRAAPRMEHTTAAHRSTSGRVAAPA